MAVNTDELAKEIAEELGIDYEEGDLSPKEVFESYFSKDFIEGTGRKSFNIFTDRDAFGLFLMLIKLDKEFSDADWNEEQERWWTKAYESFSFSIDPTTVTKILYPVIKEASKSAQYRKIKRLFDKLVESELLHAVKGEQRITGYEIHWYGVLKLLIKFIASTGDASRHHSKKIEIHEQQRFKALVGYGEKHTFSPFRPHEPKDSYEKIAIPNEHVLKFLEQYYYYISNWWELSRDLTQESETLTFENSFMMMASRYRLRTEQHLRNTFLNLVNENKANDVDDAMFFSVTDILRHAHEKRAEHDVEIGYYIAFFHLLATFNEYYYGYEPVQDLMWKTSKDVLNKYNANLFKKDPFL